MKDSKKISAFLRGNERAFEDLMKKYQRQIFYLVRAMVADTEEARDITQKTFIIAFNKLHFLKKKDQFKAWLFKIAVNKARDHLKTKKEGMEFEAWMSSDRGPSPEAACMKNDLKRLIRDALSCLPPRQKEVIVLRIFQDLDFKDIALILEMKSGTARANFHFGLIKIRDHLRKSGVSHEL